MNRVQWWPRSRPGKWSAAGLAILAVLIVLRVVLDASIRGPDPAALGWLGKAAFIAAALAGILAAWAVVRAGERSVTAFAAILLAGFAVLFELLVPH